MKNKNKRIKWENQGYGDSLFDMNFMSNLISFQITGIGIQCDYTDYNIPPKNTVPSTPFQEIPYHETKTITIF
jgi:hypothetical protein